MKTGKVNKYVALTVNAPKMRKDTTRRTTRKADAVTMYTRPSFDTDAPLTDTAAAYVMHVANNAVYHTLSAIYRATAHPRVFALIREWCQVNEYDTPEFVEDTQRNAQKTVQRNGEHVKVSTEYATQRRVKHDRVYDSVLRRYVPIRPWYSLELTETAREMFNDMKMPDDLDVYDLISVANVAALELVRCGAVIEWHDFNANLGHVCRAVSREIYANKRAAQAVSDYVELWTDENAVVTVYGKRAVEKALTIPQADLFTAIADTLKSVHARKDFDAQLAVDVLKLYAIHGYTQSEIASMYGTTQRRVSRLLTACEQLAHTPETVDAIRELLAD